MKRLKASLAAVMFFLCLSAEAQVVERIVAVVNDEVITLSELNAAFEPYQAKLVATYTGAARERALTETKTVLLNRMIDNLLMEQQARKAKIVISDEDVNNAIKSLLERRNISQEDMRKALEQEGATMEAYKKGVLDQIMRMRLVQREIKSKVAVSDEEIGEYYRKHREEYEGKDAVRIKQIFLPLPKEVDPAVKERLRADVDQIRKRLLAGEPFDVLSARYSQGPAAAAGGDIGFIEKGMILHEVEEVAFRLPLQQISDIIESSAGFHIIQVVDRRGEGIKSIESVREEIRAKIEQEKMEKKFTEWLEDLRTKSHIEIKL
jgi:peptidyl-prolyl cis-trans isomerase SurA